METLLSIALGLGLAAAAGLRVFVPVFGVGIAAQVAALPLSPTFAWVGTTPALVAFGTATVLEIGAYYVPWLDHALDLVATPAAVVAGVVASAAVITDLPPLVTWAVALIGGGGAAGVMQMLSVGARLKSTATTAGVGNPVIATGESAGAIAMTATALLVPVVALVAFLAVLVLGIRVARRRRARRALSP